VKSPFFIGMTKQGLREYPVLYVIVKRRNAWATPRHGEAAENGRYEEFTAADSVCGYGLEAARTVKKQQE